MKKICNILFAFALITIVYCAADYLIPTSVGSKKAMAVTFDDVDNCRQLGGYCNRQGKKVKSGVLVRSGKLCKLTDEGKLALRKMGVKTVIDLRIPEEIMAKPDPKLDGVKYVRINLADAKCKFYLMSKWGVGVTAENYDSVVTAIAKTNMDLGEMYIEGVIESDYGRKALKQVFSLLSNHKDGAILWHCSGGKDRTGIVAALLLSVLDVDRETILNDYELTNDFVQGERLVMKFASLFFGDTDKEKLGVATIAGVRRDFMAATLSYIDLHYGSPLQFLRTQCGVTDTEIQRIKNNYLE